MVLLSLLWFVSCFRRLGLSPVRPSGFHPGGLCAVPFDFAQGRLYGTPPSYLGLTRHFRAGLLLCRPCGTGCDLPSASTSLSRKYTAVEAISSLSVETHQDSGQALLGWLRFNC